MAWLTDSQEIVYMVDWSPSLERLWEEGEVASLYEGPQEMRVDGMEKGGRG